jgi:hypothetical protein
MARAFKDGRPTSIRSGGLAWLLPVTIAATLALAAVAAYFLYKILTYEGEGTEAAVDQGKEGVPTIEENRAAIERPVVWKVDMVDLPEGAEVYVENVLRGERPIILEGNKSPYLFRIEAPGYVTWENRIEVHSDLSLKIPMLTPEEVEALAAKSRARKHVHEETASGPAVIEFDGSSSGEDESVKKKKKGKLDKSAAPALEKLKKIL